MQSREKILYNCCNMKLSTTVSHNFSFVRNANVFVLKTETVCFYETCVCTYECTWCHSREGQHTYIQ
jgi:hypothetical protein